jgi:hypothetical protein
MSAAIAGVRPAAAMTPAVARVGSNLMPLSPVIAKRKTGAGPCPTTENLWLC